MQHAIELEELGPQGPHMAQAVESCVHCGFCLATCPTYVVMGEEMDSPRGRIILMKEALEGTLPQTDMLPYVDRCLGCMACVTACPSGVEYGDLLGPFRARAETTEPRPWFERMTRKLVHMTLPYPGRFRAAARTGGLARPLARFLPARLRAMVDLLPQSLPAAQPVPEHVPAQGRRRARVALLAGCAQQVLAPDINQATLRVLARNGVEVLIPKEQVCCGSLASHTGEADLARRFALQNMDAFPGSEDVDAIITNAAGCGSGMHEYPLLFAGTEHAARAQAFAARVQDVSQFLAGLGLMETPTLAEPCKVAYHDACHLAHAQGVTAAPRQLLTSIQNLSLAPIAEAELCCGSAGVYNIEQPALAHEIGARKAQNIAATSADAVATGNIGCMVQVEKHLRAQGSDMPVLHTIQVLDRAYRHQDLRNRQSS